MKIVKNLDAELKKKLKNLEYFEKVNRDAIALGFVSAICFINGLNMSSKIDDIRELVRSNMVENGHEDRVDEVLELVTEEKLAGAVPILGYRLFDFFEKRKAELNASYAEKKRNQEAMEVAELAAKRKKNNSKKKFVVKVHKK